MSERGRARYTHISAGSNTTVKTGYATLYGVHVAPQAGTIVRVDDDDDMGTTPNLNASDTDTLVYSGTYANTAPAFIDLGPGVGINTGIVIAATSNAKLTIVWE